MKNPETYNRVVTVGVDIQNDFCPGGSLEVAFGDEVVPALNRVAGWTRQQNGLVAFTRDWHPSETNHFADFGGPWPIHCVAGTPGAQFKNGLDIQPADTILSKGTAVDEDAYSGFQAKATDGTTLETLLRPTAREKVAVVIGGLATDYCVKATVLDALQLARKFEDIGNERKLGVFVMRDAIRAVNVNKYDDEKAIREMEAAGAQFTDSDSVVRQFAFKAGA